MKSATSATLSSTHLRSLGTASIMFVIKTSSRYLLFAEYVTIVPSHLGKTLLTFSKIYFSNSVIFPICSLLGILIVVFHALSPGAVISALFTANINLLTKSLPNSLSNVFIACCIGVIARSPALNVQTTTSTNGRILLYISIFFISASMSSPNPGISYTITFPLAPVYSSIFPYISASSFVHALTSLISRPALNSALIVDDFPTPVKPIKAILGGSDRFSKLLFHLKYLSQAHSCFLQRRFKFSKNSTERFIIKHLSVLLFAFVIV